MARGACLARLETEGLAATRPGREREEMENECILRVGVSECRARDASSSNRIVFARNRRRLEGDHRVSALRDGL